MKYPSLYEPIKIGNTYFRNRIFSSPTGHPDVSDSGTVTDDVIAYFERKAQGGAAAVTFGESSIDTVQWKQFRHMLNLESRNGKVRCLTNPPSFFAAHNVFTLFATVLRQRRSPRRMKPQ